MQTEYHALIIFITGEVTTMKVIKPEPFTFREGSQAVLLLHGFTGNSADVRMLGRFLQKQGYTSHGPIYRGHGLTPEDIIQSNPEQWWEDVLEAYHYLQFLGYQDIAVAGLSLGGVLGLKLAYTEDVKAVIPMCTPMFFDNERQLTAGFRLYAKEYKQLERKDEETIERELDQLKSNSTNLFKQLGEFVEDVNQHVKSIEVPTLVIQAEDDQMINPDSATFIYENVGSSKKEIKWYEEAGHAITLGPKRDQVHEDVYEFLESLDWDI